MSLYVYKAKVLNIVDGDTIDLLVDLGFNITQEIRFRFELIDTAETYRPRNAAERAHGAEATQYLHDILGEEPIIIKTNKDKHGKYRYLAKIYDTDGSEVAELISVLDDSLESINERMIGLGFAKRENYPEE